MIQKEGLTPGAIIFGKLEELFQKHGLSFGKVNLVVTDGVATMIVLILLTSPLFLPVASSIDALRCLIHQSVLCAKLSGSFKEVMEKTMKIINSIKSNSNTQHRL